MALYKVNFVIITPMSWEIEATSEKEAQEKTLNLKEINELEGLQDWSSIKVTSILNLDEDIEDEL